MPDRFNPVGLSLFSSFDPQNLVSFPDDFRACWGLFRLRTDLIWALCQEMPKNYVEFSYIDFSHPGVVP